MHSTADCLQTVYYKFTNRVRLHSRSFHVKLSLILDGYLLFTAGMKLAWTYVKGMYFMFIHVHDVLCLFYFSQHLVN